MPIPSADAKAPRRGRRGRIANDGFLASLAGLVRGGASPEECCESLRISRATYYRAVQKIEAIRSQAMRDAK